MWLLICCDRADEASGAVSDCACGDGGRVRHFHSRLFRISAEQQSTTAGSGAIWRSETRLELRFRKFMRRQYTSTKVSAVRGAVMRSDSCLLRGCRHWLAGWHRCGRPGDRQSIHRRQRLANIQRRHGEEHLQSSGECLSCLHLVRDCLSQHPVTSVMPKSSLIFTLMHSHGMRASPAGTQWFTTWSKVWCTTALW